MINFRFLQIWKENKKAQAEHYFQNEKLLKKILRELKRL